MVLRRARSLASVATVRWPVHCCHCVASHAAFACRLPELISLRDVAVLGKFLATMETREDEQLRRRHAMREYQPWRLTFDGESRLPPQRFIDAPLQFEPVDFRGVDRSIADLRVTAFGGARELRFGDGPLMRSPIDVARLIDAPHVRQPTEDDVLHADALVRSCCFQSPHVRVVSQTHSEQTRSQRTRKRCRAPRPKSCSAT